MSEKEKTAVEHKKTTKKHLRKLSRNSRHHPLRSSLRIIKYGTKSFSRNIWLSVAATLVMAITLIVLFSTLILNVILSNTADTLREKIDIPIYFYPGTSRETLNELTEIIKVDPNIKEVKTFTTEEEYNLTIEENKDNEELISVLTDDSMNMKELMLKVTQSTMHIKVYDPDNLDSIKTIVETNELFVKNVDPEKESGFEINRTEIETISSWAKIAKNSGIIIGAIFLVISILIIFNTVRMAIFSRREEIYMMRLVGAGKSFIRGPFLIEAQISGIIAGALGATISYFGFNYLSPKLISYGIDISFIENILKSNQLVLVYLAMILLGILIGTFSASLAIRRYLRKAK